MIDKNYDAASVEPKIATKWDDANAFAAGAGAREGEDSYTIVIPPPNVTGSLHMGHALNNTLQDILIRFERMRGKDVLWQPGMDHAGIATQMVVERKLAEDQQPSRQELGREEFLKRVWAWKEESGGTIFNQLKRLGASCDWSRERFTMDEGLSAAVLEVFVKLHEEGLIYRGKRLVNWDPHFETAISDLEVENIEVDGHMWHFKYPLAGGETYTYVEKDEDGAVKFTEERDYISIATTRPETMLGDGAVAVHPKDERYASIVGKLCEIPVGPKEHRRLIPIITDEYPDPEFGSGAVKITGAHDFNDYQVAKRNDIPLYRLMDEKAAMRDDGLSYADCANQAKSIVESGELPSEADVDAINLVPDDYRGLDRFEARKKIIEDINAEGLAVMVPGDPEESDGNVCLDPGFVPFVENKKVMQPFGDRSKVVIEPMLTDQWFADAKTLAEPAIASVREERTNFVPKTWENTYFNWMENIEPWCISRQLWWGHRIPVWYGPNGKMFCAENYELALDKATQYYEELNDDAALAEELNLDSGIYKFSNIEVNCLEESYDLSGRDLNENIEGSVTDFHIYEPEDGGYPVVRIQLTRDPDVLDTWFSSALWPFSTLGWPDQTNELHRYYQTDVLVTGFDIIFFWVARMMMMGLHFMKDDAGNPVEPFHTVYVHALVRDKHGAKMSKSKGNVIDPLGLIDEYGADALRFTLCAMAAQGRDVKLDPARIAGYRNFGTKLWNATRFSQMNEVKRNPDFDPSNAKLTVNRWILTELSACVEEMNANLEKYRFNDVANCAYKFVWNNFCDWYLELLKPIFSGDNKEEKQEAQECAGFVLDQIYKLLHPMMPFMTEELWAQTDSRDDLLCHAPWPQVEMNDESAADEINWLIDLITQIRSVKAEMNIKPSEVLDLHVVDAGDETRARLETQQSAIMRLARVNPIEIKAQAPKGSAQIVIGEATYCLPLEGVIDFDAERERLDKEHKKLIGEVKRLEGKLGNQKFVANAPEAVVAEEREKLTDYQEKMARIETAMSRISG